MTFMPLPLPVYLRDGFYGDFGGAFVAETLMQPLLDLKAAYLHLREDQNFWKAYQDLIKTYVGRPSSLTYAERWSQDLGGAQIYLKREDLLHTGAHKINNAVGQALVAKFLGKKRIIAETGAGQHGVAVAAVCAHMGLECCVYMGRVDMERQAPNVARMRMMGAKVEAVEHGNKTLKDAVNQAMRDWVTNLDSSYYLLGSALGPDPYPLMVRDFQCIIGMEAKEQFEELHGTLPQAVVACVGGGSNSIGIFSAFLSEQVQLFGVEAGGHGPDLGQHAARFDGGKPGVFQGMRSFVLQTDQGQIVDTASISAGLDYASIGPEHAYLYQTRRVEYVRVSDDEAMEAVHVLAEKQGIIPALESAHALAYAAEIAASMSTQDSIIVCLSGRGDKDLTTMQTYDEKGLIA